MQKFWSQIENIPQTTHAHLGLRRSSVNLGMLATSEFFGLDYRPSDCAESSSEKNNLPGLPASAGQKQLKI